MRRPKTIKFADYPDFRPNLTPRQIFELGSFGGTYWRPIDSAITGKRHTNAHKRFPAAWWKGIKADWLTRPWNEYDKTINRYAVRVGTTLEFWEKSGWINREDPYGWVQWYSAFYQGRRGPDDERQIKRWLQTAGPRSRFRLRLINMIKAKGAGYNDETISPKIRQTLQHWGYQLTRRD